MNQKKKYAVISHDAGGAELLSSLIRNTNLDCNYCIRGPAKNIFKNKLKIKNARNFERIIEGSTIVLCTSSWESDHEYKAIKYAKKIKKYTIVLFDHWVFYKERLIRRNLLVIPDEIWVVDKYAKEIASKHFPMVKIKIKKNYFLQNFQKYLSNNQSNANTNNILYVCEPIKNHAIKMFNNAFYFGYDEYEALSFFLRILPKLKIKYNKIIIRPHPSESKMKYNYLKKISNKISISNSKLLINDILSSHSVFGCDTMAMVVAKKLKKKVYCTIPKSGKKLSIPINGIVRLNENFK